jgi:hypothetical protein
VQLLQAVARNVAARQPAGVAQRPRAAYGQRPVEGRRERQLVKREIVERGELFVDGEPLDLMSRDADCGILHSAVVMEDASGGEIVRCFTLT